ncbi:MAG TPA: Hsp70 family protein, partial [Acidimicrobiales bacterium]|nr:Hsp70 family protein [Acidimicrobiales bacterium]
EDRRRREEAEVRNSADSLVYSTEKLLKEQGDKLQGDEKTQVEEKLAALKSAISGTDVEAIKSATEALMTASQGFTQRLYEQAAASERAAGDTAASSQPSDDDVVDAEIVDEDQS